MGDWSNRLKSHPPHGAPSPRATHFNKFTQESFALYRARGVVPGLVPGTHWREGVVMPHHVYILASRRNGTRLIERGNPAWEDLYDDLNG